MVRIYTKTVPDCFELNFFFFLKLSHFLNVYFHFCQSWFQSYFLLLPAPPFKLCCGLGKEVRVNSLIVCACVCVYMYVYRVWISSNNFELCFLFLYFFSLKHVSPQRWYIRFLYTQYFNTLCINLPSFFPFWWGELRWVFVVVHGLFLSGTRASLVMVHGLSCPELCEILITWSGIEPTSPALEGRFLTTGPPGK